MLTPDQKDHLILPIENLFDGYQTSVLKDIARRMASMQGITEASAWQMQRLTESGAVYLNALKELAKLTGQTPAKLASAFKKAGVEVTKYDETYYRQAGKEVLPLNESPAMQAALQAALTRTQGTLTNLTQTTAIMAENTFRDALDLAYMQVSTGTMSWQEAIKAGIKDASAKGLSTIDYASGHQDSLDVAVRRAVLTGVSQMAGNLQITQAATIGTDLVEVSAHTGARSTGAGPANHASWQGKVYSISGTSKKYPSLNEVTGYGTGAGLYGWNCRHDMFPFIEGVSTPSYAKEELKQYQEATVPIGGKQVPLYEATQMQRGMERHVRAYKRQAACLEAAGFDAEAERSLAMKWQNKLLEFTQETGLDRQRWREQVYDKPQSKAAPQALPEGKPAGGIDWQPALKKAAEINPPVKPQEDEAAKKQAVINSIKAAQKAVADQAYKDEQAAKQEAAQEEQEAKLAPAKNKTRLAELQAKKVLSTQEAQEWAKGSVYEEPVYLFKQYVSDLPGWKEFHEVFGTDNKGNEMYPGVSLNKVQLATKEEFLKIVANSSDYKYGKIFVSLEEYAKDYEVKLATRITNPITVDISAGDSITGRDKNIAKALGMTEKEYKEQIAIKQKQGFYETEAHRQYLIERGYDSIIMKDESYVSRIVVLDDDKIKAVSDFKKFDVKPGTMPDAKTIEEMTKAAIPWDPGDIGVTEVDSPVKNQVVTAIKDRLANEGKGHIDYDKVNSVIAQWARTSNDDSITSLRIQEAAKRKLGGTFTDWQKQHLEALKDTFAKKIKYNQNIDKTSAGRDFTLSNSFTDQDLDDTLGAIYQNTQDYFKERGITHVTLYRGVVGSESVTSNSDKNFISKNIGKEVNIENNALSSWSTTKVIARRFTDYEDADGIMMKITVPVDRILSTAVSGQGCLNEFEMVLIGNDKDRGIIEWAGERFTKKSK